ncbi:hypothetical protein [Paenibacillus tyrfis]|uniref:Uncharacterized protein n=1 Tax=Paenibacillus tyrfis TaxID=1501230 RepID=A0A081NZ64_9BACL|nr:hypothetical protein [Paenibacillus tyrfis]KEQ23737.1 hypothetical protein ET33_14790 [Paenibacillus tyrfis]
MNFGLKIFERTATAFGQVPKLVQSARTGILRISTMAFLQFQRVSEAASAWVTNLKKNIIQKLRQIRLPSLNIPSSMVRIVINVTINVSGNLSALQQLQRSPGKISGMFRNMGEKVNKAFQNIKQFKLPSLNLKPIARAAEAIKQVLFNAFTAGLQKSKQVILAISTGFGKLRNYISTALQKIRLPNVGQWFRGLRGTAAAAQGTANAGPQRASNTAAQNAKSSFQKFGSAFGSLLSENGQKLFQATIGGAMEQQKRKDMFIERAGGDKKNDKFGESMFEFYKAEALGLGVDVNEYLSSALTFMPVAQNADQISKLNNIAHRLATFDPQNQGLQANGLAVKEALSGDTASMAALAKRFGMSQNQVNELKLDELADKGDIEGFVSAFDKLLEQNNMGQKAYEIMINSPTEQVGTLVTNVKNAFAEMGQAAFQAFGKLSEKINEAFKSQKFQSFIEGIRAGLFVIADITSTVVQFLVNNFGLVQNILVALGIVLLVLAGIWLVQWFAALWPVFLVIAAIVILLEILNYFGITTSEVIGFVIGLFMSLEASINNFFAVYWNILVAFAEFFANVLTDPAYALQKLFYDIFLSLHEYFSNFINDCVKGVNWLIEKFNDFAGTEIPPIPTFKVEVEKLKPKTDKDVVDYSNRRMGQKSTFDAIGEGQKFMNAIMPPVVGNPDDKTNDIKERVKKWTNVPKNFPAGKQPGSELPNLNHVNSIGQIDNTVDISSEDLEVMRDLAEIQSIQNFVTLTPTVQVTTGDIHQPTDANEMIRRIEEVMSREIANSAQGVYA